MTLRLTGRVRVVHHQSEFQLFQKGVVFLLRDVDQVVRSLRKKAPKSSLSRVVNGNTKNWALAVISAGSYSDHPFLRPHVFLSLYICMYIYIYISLSISPALAPSCPSMPNML